MKHYILMAICGATLSACSLAGGNNSAFLYNGNDTSFLRQGTTTCVGIVDSGSSLYDRYPLRCGPQSQR